MKKKTKPCDFIIVAFAVIIVVGLFTSCKKAFNESLITTNSQTKDGFPNQLFNWETSTVMMPSLSAGSLNPSLPWTSQSGNYIDPAIISDYKSSDGWVLVYNTFNPTYYQANASSGGLYFALYNVYRGLLRYYLYIPGGQFGGGSQIEHGLSIYSGIGATTSMLNFNGSDIVDPLNNVKSFTTTSNQGVAYNGGWYAMQYEIAYDPNFSNASFPNLGITWNSRTVNISQIQLNGQLTGSINGTISQQSSGFNWSSTLINAGLAIGEIYAGNLGANQGFSGLNQAAQGGLSGSISGFLSAIFGGNSNNSQEVDLKMNANLSLSGTITTPNYLAPNSFVFPGESIASGNLSYPPLYNNPLGVFNISQRPTVQVTATTITPPPGSTNYPTIKNTFSLIPSSYQVLMNPVVSSSANVSVIKTDLLIPSNIVNSEFGKIKNDMPSEVIGQNTYYRVNSSNSYVLGYDTPTMGNVVVRITIKVTPNNGAPSSTIVKSFIGNLTN